MAFKLSNLINSKKSKWFFVYFIIGALALAAAVLLAPIWAKQNIDVFFKDWGYKSLKIIIAVLIFLYVALYLSKQFKGNNSVTTILTIVEITLLAVIALAGVVSQFSSALNLQAGQIIGLALWLRGTVESFKAYYYRGGEQRKYPIYMVVFSVALITLGVVFFMGNFITDEFALWFVVIMLAVIAIAAIVLGAVKKPVKAAASA